MNGLNVLDNFQFKVPEINLPEMPDMPNWYMWSDTQFELIKQYIEEFEASLDTEHEVGVMLTNFGQSVLMQVTEIRYDVHEGKSDVIGSTPGHDFQTINILKIL